MARPVRKYVNPTAARWVLLPWLLLSPTAWGDECVIKEFFAEDSAPRELTGGPIIKVGTSSVLRPIQLTMGSDAPQEPETPKERRERQRWDAIRNRDLVAFVKGLPADEAARRKLLQQALALDEAFRASALPIVRQILKWDPSGLSERYRGSNSMALEGVARSWQRLEESRRSGDTVKNWPDPQDQVELIRMLLNAGADPDGHGDWLTPLGVIASLQASPETLRAAEMLLRRGATLERRGADGRSPLALAAQQKNAELVRLMLEWRQPSQDVLDEAIVKGPFVASNGAVALLLERGANINADGSKYGFNSTYYPAMQAGAGVKDPGGPELMQLLIRHKVDPNLLYNELDSPLMEVMHHLELMKGLLDLGADPNNRNRTGDTPLHVATRVPGHAPRAPEDIRPPAVIEPGLDAGVRSKSVAMLLQYGADPNGRDGSGATPLMLTGPDDAETVDLLLSRGGKLNLDEKVLHYYHQYKAPVGPVSWSVLHRNDQLGAALVRRNARIPPEDCGAVFYAAQTGSIKTLAALLDLNANAGVESDWTRMTPLLVAAKNGQAKAISVLLVRRVASVNEMIPVSVHFAGGDGPFGLVLIGGQTALMIAALHGHKAAVEELIRHGAGINRFDSNGKTALDYARQAEQMEIVELLKANGARE